MCSARVGSNPILVGSLFEAGQAPNARANTNTGKQTNPKLNPIEICTILHLGKERAQNKPKGDFLTGNFTKAT